MAGDNDDVKESIDRVESLGVSAAERGFACVRVAPVPLVNGTTSGSVPIPGGEVSVVWTNSDSQFILEVAVPTGNHLQVRLPAEPFDGIYVDGEPIAEDTQILRSDHFVDLAVLPGSRYLFVVNKMLQPQL